MATEDVSYIAYAEAALIHIELMRGWGETRYGVFERSLAESALARPRHAAAYEGADLVRQAATLCFGLIRNHPWVGGDKRTAAALVDSFLFRNGIEVAASAADSVEMTLAVESSRWGVDEIEGWLRRRVRART